MEKVIVIPIGVDPCDAPTVPTLGERPSPERAARVRSQAYAFLCKLARQAEERAAISQIEEVQTVGVIA